MTQSLYMKFGAAQPVIAPLLKRCVRLAGWKVAGGTANRRLWND
jgi:hypothetical protein